MTKIEVGRFTLDPETGTLEGPADYMREAGNARIARIVAGDDVVFNTAMGKSPSPLWGPDGPPLSPNIETAILVSLQTDYAGWIGSRSLFGSEGGAT